MLEDWDNLIILDACRYDMFKQMNTIEGKLEWRRSKGSATWEFSQNNFSDREYFDIVYVNANPRVSLVTEDTFHYQHDVWQNAWDSDQGTVMPNTMVQQTLEMERKYPKKRIVAHFLQPHHPFLGQTALAELRDLSGNTGARNEALNDNEQTGSGPDERDHIWAKLEKGEIELDIIREAYYESLQETLPYVDFLCSKLKGKTVVTSDHGNLLGEQSHPRLPWKTQRFAHPDHATAKVLVKVPWLVCPFDSRKFSIPETPEKRRSVYNEDSLEQKLESLGYK